MTRHPGLYFRQKFNFVKSCADATKNDCWTPAQQAGYDLGTSPEMSIGILANGASVLGPLNWPNQEMSAAIDWNGPNPPNQIGQDIMVLTICGRFVSHAADTNANCSEGSGTLVSEGRVTPYSWFSGINKTNNDLLYQSLFNL